MGLILPLSENLQLITREAVKVSQVDYILTLKSYLISPFLAATLPRLKVHRKGHFCPSFFLRHFSTSVRCSHLDPY